MFHQPHFDDGRGHLPETVRARAPRGFGAMIRIAAQREGVSASEFIRRTLAEKVGSSLQQEA